MIDGTGWMDAAISAATENMRRGAGGPFGASIVREGRVLAVAANEVLGANDPTAHAEVVAIRRACAELKSPFLEDAVIYSTTEPCPMCFSAIHWARISRIVFGTSISDVHALGFNELSISNEQMKQLGGSRTEIVGGFMREECMALLREWIALPNKQTY